MAEAESPSTKDLLLLITGLQVLKEPPLNAEAGEYYWLTEPTTDEKRTLRESQLNPHWLRSPKLAWEGVRFRDYLITTLFGNIADNKHDFIAITEPLVASMDVLTKDFKRHMSGVTDEIRQALVSKSGKERSLFSTLAVGISKLDNNRREVYVLGLGVRRRASFWVNADEALQADVEFFLPFFDLSNTDQSEKVFHQYSLNAGIAVSRSNKNPIGVDEDGKDLIAARFNVRIPFGAGKVKVADDKYEFKTTFGTPQIGIEKRIRETRDSDPSEWKKFTGWKDFVKNFYETTEGVELLNVPIGPLLLAKVEDGSAVGDIILNESKVTEIKKQLAESKKEFKETKEFLKNIWEYKPPEKKDFDAPSTQRKLGNMLAFLGFGSSKPGSGGEYDYKFKIEDGLTVWDVVDRTIRELDGQPLYVSGLKTRTEKETRIALSLASQKSETDANNVSKNYFGIAGLMYNKLLKTISEEQPATKDDDPETTKIVVSKENFTRDESILIEEEEEDHVGQQEQESRPTPPKQKEEVKGTIDVFFHVGKWLSGETLDDNWLKRLLPTGGGPDERIPVPGVRLLPFKRVHEPNLLVGRQEATLDWTFRADVVSLGFDIKGTTKKGLTFLEGVVGHFGLGAFEIRLAAKLSLEDFKTEKSFFDRVSIGLAIKLKDLRLSFGPREEEEEKKGGDELLEGLRGLLADDWAVVPAPRKPEEKTVRTRLSAKKKDKFSISVGYLTPLKSGSHGTLDIQLYDEKGVRGKMALIPIDREFKSIYLKQIGIGLKGLENVELSNGVPDSANLTVALTGGIRTPVFELGFINAKVSFQLNNPRNFKLSIDGLDVSVKIGSVIISGSFFRSGFEFAGSLTVDVPKASFSAMGFYGSIVAFEMSRETDVVADLNRGKVHTKLLTKLREDKITPRTLKPIEPGFLPRQWELYSTDNQMFIVIDEDDELHVLRPDKTFFIFAMLNAATGGGITFGPVQFTGIAFGYGYNRRLKVPTIEKVGKFPLVQIVMGEGGYQDEDESLTLHGQLGKPVEDPAAVLKDMSDVVVAERGQQFACAGARFTLSGLIDCFALLIVQWGNEFEISLLGLARFRHTRDLTAKAICYVEMQILMSIKPSEGTFKLEGLLTSNSWIITTDCKLTGGFAIYVWFDGPHKGQWVVTFGGYHPRFRRPDHYPVVPRIGLNWLVNHNLSIKGGIYLAVTPSCLMYGTRLEATFHSGRISAWFTGHLDVVVNWDPPSFEAEIGISLRVECAFSLKAIKLTIGATLQMWGPPVGGTAHIDFLLWSFDIDFGTPRPAKPELTNSWQEFCHKFLKMKGGDTRAIKTAVKAFPIVQPSLAAGRNNLNSLPNSLRNQPQVKPEDGVWKVRADQLELAATTAVPVSTLNFGTVKTASPPEGIQNPDASGQPMMVTEPVKLVPEGLQTKKSSNALGVHPMGKTLDSVLHVTVVRDEGSVADALNLSGWTIEEETGPQPAALWDDEKPKLKLTEPTAKLIDGCITGIKRLKPPSGKLGPHAPLTQISWQPLALGKVTKSSATLNFPSTTHSRNVQQVMARKKAEQEKIASALSMAGFSLTWQPMQAGTQFRELQADPLAEAVGRFN